eukprot:Gb_13711 [translate_table: standard]
MASLEELLAEEGFRRIRKERKEHRSSKSSFRNSSNSEEVVAAVVSLPRYISRENKPVKITSRSAPVSGAELRPTTRPSKPKAEFAQPDSNREHASRKKPDQRDYKPQRSKGKDDPRNQRAGSFKKSEEKSIPEKPRQSSESMTEMDGERIVKSVEVLNQKKARKEPALGEAAVKAVISMLSGYCNRFVRDEELRSSLRMKCGSCLRVKNWDEQQYAEQAVIANLDWGIDGVETVARAEAGTKEAKSSSLQNAMRMLSVAASLDADDLKDGTTCGVANSCLAACAHLYLAITFKLQKKDRIAALHLLQIFCVSPSQGRLHFAQEIWEYLFLPHLLHLKVWYNQEFDSLQSAGYDDSERLKRRLKRLKKVYVEYLDEGTRQFALYYKEWLMIGVKARAVPSVELPSSKIDEIVSESPAVFAGRQGSTYSDSPVGRTPLRRSLCEAVFGTPRRIETHEAERTNTIHSTPDRAETPLRVGIADDFKQNVVTTVVEEAEELEMDSDDHELKTDEGYMEEGSTQVTYGQAKGAEKWGLTTGVILEGKELREEELLQLWDHVSNKSTFLEKCSIVCKLSDREGKGLTLKKLSEIVSQMKQIKTFTNSISHLNPLSSTEMSEPHSDSECLFIAQRETEPPETAKQGEEIRRENNSVSPSTDPTSPKSVSSAGLTPQNVNVYFRQSSLVRIPKDFVCPVTDQLFEDPVTLETGQTYERSAIQEWLSRGNTTCPISRQRLESLTLPNTNFVLKRVVDAWKTEHSGFLKDHVHADTLLGHSVSCIYKTENPIDLSSFWKDSTSKFSGKLNEKSQMETSSPQRLLTRCFSQNTRESFDPTPIPQFLLSNLKQSITTLCTSDNLRECEGAVQTIGSIWMQSNGHPIVETSLSKADIIDEFMEVLSTSKEEDVVRTTTCILAELALKSDLNREAILRADSDLEIILQILGTSLLPQAAILLYLLKPQTSQLVSRNIIPLLLRVPEETDNLKTSFSVHCTSQEAVMFLLEQQVTALDHATSVETAKQVIALEGIPFLVRRIEFGTFRERISATTILWCCMHADGSCRQALVKDIKKASIVELLHCNQGISRTVAIAFLTELLRLNRRALINKFLSELQKEGLLNTMHVLLVYLQTAPLEQQPMAATLLLQLDLLVQPRRYSVYREEAKEALVAALHCERNAKAQIQSAKALLLLGGRFSYSGRALLEAWLLKKAGLEDDLTDSLKEEQGPLEEIVKRWNEDKKAADDWERKMASVLVANGKSLFEALARSLSSGIPELAKPCLVTATWLNCALASMPDTGMQLVACSILLPQLIKSLQPDRQVKERALASLSLHSYMKNPDIFVHGEVAQMDASVNGETQALIYGKGKLYSGHADGSIKVWDVRNKQPKLINEVKEHERPVTCLAISQSSDRLFSASADKSIRIWKLDLGNPECIEVIELKEVVRRIYVFGLLTFIISEGHGIKVLDGYRKTKVLNGNKHVQGLAIAGNKVYSGCADGSIQEVDLGSEEVASLQLGQRAILGKKSAVHALQVYNDFLYTAGNSIEGVSAQVWKLKNRSLAATISTSADVKAMAVNEDFIYLGCNSSTGLIEVWLRAKLEKVAVLSVQSRLTALALGEDVLYSASEDGRIRHIVGGTIGDIKELTIEYFCIGCFRFGLLFSRNDATTEKNRQIVDG